MGSRDRCRGARLRNDRPGVQVLAFLPAGKGLATLSAEGVRLWDETTGMPFATFRSPVPRSYKVGAVSPDGRIVVAGDEGGMLQVWDSATGRVFSLDAPAQKRRDRDGVPLGRPIAPDRRQIRSDPRLGPRDLAGTGTNQPRRPNPLFRAAPDDTTLAFGNFLSEVQLWDLPSKRVVERLYGYCWETADQIKFAPNGRSLAVAAHKGSVTLWRPKRLQSPAPP